MADEVADRSFNFVVTTTKLTVRTMVTGIRMFARKMEEDERINKARSFDPGKKNKQAVHGKQSVKELFGQDASVKTINVSDEGFKEFEGILKKCGMDYAVTKDTKAVPPKYMVFYKAKDADVVTSVLTECMARQVGGPDKQKKEGPDQPEKASVHKMIQDAMDKLLGMKEKGKIREKTQERIL